MESHQDSAGPEASKGLLQKLMAKRKTSELSPLLVLEDINPCSNSCPLPSITLYLQKVALYLLRVVQSAENSNEVFTFSTAAIGDTKKG